MAVRVSKLPSTHAWQAGGEKTNRYPWTAWLDGSIWKIGPDDYRGRVDSFRMAAYQQAKRVGLRVRIRQPDSTGTLYIQAYREKGRKK